MTHESANWRNKRFMYLISMKLNGNILRGDGAQQAFRISAIYFFLKTQTFPENSVNWYCRLLINGLWSLHFKLNWISWLLVVAPKRNPLKLDLLHYCTGVYFELPGNRRFRFFFPLLQGLNWAMACKLSVAVFVVSGVWCQWM